MAEEFFGGLDGSVHSALFATLKVNGSETRLLVAVPPDGASVPKL